MGVLINTAKLTCVILIVSVSSTCAPQTAINLNVGVHNGSVLIPILLNGEHLKFLFDTGSTRSTVAVSVVERLRLERRAETDALGKLRSAITGYGSREEH
jgi:predicted aspartyl protease